MQLNFFTRIINCPLKTLNTFLNKRVMGKLFKRERHYANNSLAKFELNKVIVGRRNKRKEHTHTPKKENPPH